MTHSRSKLFAALGSAALVPTFWLVNPATAVDRLRIGLSSFTPINAAVWIAEDKGLFKKYGIDPEVIVNKGVQRVMARADLKRPEDLKGNGSA